MTDITKNHLATITKHLLSDYMSNSRYSAKPYSLESQIRE